MINASLCGIVQAWLDARPSGRVLGMRFGIEGFMQGDVIDLGCEDPANSSGSATRPARPWGAAATSSRRPISRGFSTCSASTTSAISSSSAATTRWTRSIASRSIAAGRGYPLAGVGVPKTVDNDLFGTDHTPGFGSAARYVAISVKQAGMLARDMKRVDQYVIFQTVGRSAGWLPAASALAKSAPDDAPHIILMPERPFDRERFLADVKACHERHGWCSIVCGEGICYADGTPVSASTTTDKFTNVEFGAMGGTSAAMMLHRMIADAFGWRGEFQVCESLQMCAADRVSPTDLEEAFACGRRAVELAAARDLRA